jgi:ankyrin repeat protein
MPEVAATLAREPEEQSRLQRRLDTELYEAARDAVVAGINELFQAGANVNASIGGDGSPLIGAVRSGRPHVVALLLDRGANPNLGVTGDGSPLIAAASEGHTEIVTLLLDRGASVDLIVAGDENPLIQAAAEGHLSVVQALVKRGADVNARAWAEFGDRDNRTAGEWRTPLSMARQGRHTAVIEFLRSAGARE